jgi:hypothetical protein
VDESEPATIAEGAAVFVALSVAGAELLGAELLGAELLGTTSLQPREPERST